MFLFNNLMILHALFSFFHLWWIFLFHKIILNYISKQFHLTEWYFTFYNMWLYAKGLDVFLLSTTIFQRNRLETK